MYPLAFTFGPITISSFGVFLSVGWILAIFMLYQQYKHNVDIKIDSLFDFFILMTIGGLLGARLGYAFLYYQLFEANILRILLVRERPGLSFVGCVVGLLITFILTRVFSEIKIKKIDGFVPPLLTLVIFGQIGSFLDGFSFGASTKLPWGIAILGSPIKRHPLPLYYLPFFILLMIALPYVQKYARRNHWASGALLSLFVLYYSLLAFCINLLRTDMVTIHGYAVDQIALVSLISISFILFYNKTRSIMADSKGILALFAQTGQNIKTLIRRKK